METWDAIRSRRNVRRYSDRAAAAGPPRPDPRGRPPGPVVAQLAAVGLRRRHRPRPAHAAGPGLAIRWPRRPVGGHHRPRRGRTCRPAPPRLAPVRPRSGDDGDDARGHRPRNRHRPRRGQRPRPRPQNPRTSLATGSSPTSSLSATPPTSPSPSSAAPTGAPSTTSSTGTTGSESPTRRAARRVACGVTRGLIGDSSSISFHYSSAPQGVTLLAQLVGPRKSL